MYRSKIMFLSGQLTVQVKHLITMSCTEYAVHISTCAVSPPHKPVLTKGKQDLSELEFSLHQNVKSLYQEHLFFGNEYSAQGLTFYPPCSVCVKDMISIKLSPVILSLPSCYSSKNTSSINILFSLILIIYEQF